MKGVRRKDGDRGGAAAAARGRVPEGSRCGRKEFGGGDGGCQKTLQVVFFVTPQCETFKESGCEGTKNHLDGPKSQKCSGPLL